MAAVQYGQFLDASDPDQSADDELFLPTTPKQIRGGTFRLYYIPRDDSTYASERVLLSVNSSARLDFKIYQDTGVTYVAVMVHGSLMVRRAIEFAALTQMMFEFSGLDGHLTVTGADVGDGMTDGLSWYVGHGACRLGGAFAGGSVARGLVSLPYAVQGAEEPPEDAAPSSGGASSLIVLM